MVKTRIEDSTISQPIKILHIIKSMGRGGAEMLLPETIAVHNQLAYEFHVIYFLPWKNQMVDAVRISGGRITCFPAKNNIRILFQFRKVMKYIRQHQIDVIHCHLPWAGFLGRFIFRHTGIPVLYTEHNKQERYHILTKILNRITFNWQTAAVAVSDEVALSIEKNIHPSIPVIPVLNGINTKKFVVRREDKENRMQSEENGIKKTESRIPDEDNLKRSVRNGNIESSDPWEKGRQIRRELGIMDDEVVIGTIAVFRFQKRLDLWLELLAEIHKKNPTVKGIIVGDGPLKELVHQKYRDLNLQGVVYLPGLQTNPIEWLAAMDIYMMSSVFEGLPIALLEAMSCGIPVVCTNAGGTGEVIRDSVDGFLVPVDEPMRLIEKADVLICDPVQRKEMGIAARKRVEDSFSMERMVGELENLYKKVVLSD